MKQSIFTLLLVLFISNISISLDKISSSDAKDFVSETKTVYGVIADVFVSKNGNTFINFDKRFPDHTFTAVIFKDDVLKIQSEYNDELKTLIGKTLTINGKIETYNDKPQIVIKEYSQIESIEE